MTKVKTLELSKQSIGVKRLTFHHDFEIPPVCWNLEDFLYFLFSVAVGSVAVGARRDPQLVRTCKIIKIL